MERSKIVSLFFYHSTSLVILKRGLEISIIMFPCLSVVDPGSTALIDVTRAPLMRVNKSDFVFSAVHRNLDPAVLPRTFKLMSILGKSFGKNLLQQVRSSWCTYAAKKVHSNLGALWGNYLTGYLYHMISLKCLVDPEPSHSWAPSSCNSYSSAL